MVNIEDVNTAEDMALESDKTPLPTPKRQIFSINGKEFYTDSITEEGQQILNAISFVTKDIQETEVKIQISQIAKDSLVAKLVQESKNFGPAINE